MGKKLKVGKARKDKFYELAKTEGFRSRAAYKLLQLDGKFEFLSRATVCIDLCAAPGGWLQAAKKRMPISSIIIGIDLVPIRAIPNVITLQHDITTAECKHAISQRLKDQKANLVLHDGAPNVGKNWIHDAFQQAQLTLHALKLATSFLAAGGHFVTKVFRSKDYNALLWVFGQMFKKVHSTKPQASRNESAEIFVFCQGYLAPAKIDPKFFDMKFVFKDVDMEPKRALNLVHPEKLSKKADGYADGEVVCENKLSALEFVTNENYLDLLRNCTQIILDDERISSHKSTTQEIIECCKDIRVLGKKDIRNVLNWHKALKKVLVPTEKETVGEIEMKSDDENDEEKELQQNEKEVLRQQEEMDKEKKRKKKKDQKLERKYQEKLKLKMIIPGDRIETVDDIELFNLKNIETRQNEIADVSDQEDVSDSEDEDAEEEEDFYGIDKKITNKTEEDGKNDMEMEGDEEDVVKEKSGEDDSDSSDESDSDNYDDTEDEAENFFAKRVVGGALKADSGNEKKRKRDEIEIVPLEAKTKRIKLTPYQLALGEEMTKSKKRKREIIEMSYSRYISVGDEEAPDFFLEYEKQHCARQAPITKEQMERYKERQKAIDAQPIKKVAQAQARKKRKMVKRLEKARKKAETLTENIEMSEREKMRVAKDVYKKAGLLKPEKRKLTYVVAKKSTASGKRVARPDGVKGHYRVVDPRLKKDKRRERAAAKNAKSGKNKKKGGSKKPRK